MKDAAEIKDIVKQKYGEIAKARSEDGQPGSCCGPTSCGDPTLGVNFADGYQDLDGYVPEADLNLGCGLPVPYAGIRERGTRFSTWAVAPAAMSSWPGLVLGSAGRVIGVDMVPDMVERAKANAGQAGGPERGVPPGGDRRFAHRRQRGGCRGQQLRIEPGARQGHCVRRDPPGAQAGGAFLHLGHRTRRGSAQRTWPMRPSWSRAAWPEPSRRAITWRPSPQRASRTWRSRPPRKSSCPMTWSVDAVGGGRSGQLAGPAGWPSGALTGGGSETRLSLADGLQRGYGASIVAPAPASSQRVPCHVQKNPNAHNPGCGSMNSPVVGSCWPDAASARTITCRSSWPSPTTGGST